MTLEDKDILQVDATVITGILILLTFSLFGPSSNATTLVDIEFELSIRLASVNSFHVNAICDFCNYHFNQKR